MSGDRAADMVYLMGALVLVGSALIVRRPRGTATERFAWRPRRGMLPVAAAWLLIFAALFALAHWLDLRR